MSQDKVTPIGIVPVYQAIRDDTVDVLEKTLAEAKAGEIEEVFIIAKTADGFRELSSPTQHFAEWIGRLEIQKQGWIEAFMRHRES